MTRAAGFAPSSRLGGHVRAVPLLCGFPKRTAEYLTSTISRCGHRPENKSANRLYSGCPSNLVGHKAEYRDITFDGLLKHTWPSAGSTQYNRREAEPTISRALGGGELSPMTPHSPTALRSFPHGPSCAFARQPTAPTSPPSGSVARDGSRRRREPYPGIPPRAPSSHAIFSGASSQESRPDWRRYVRY